MFERIALIIFFLTIVCPGAAYAIDDPNSEWRELESEHFVIHYPENREVFAKRALSIAEEAHHALVPYLRWEPRHKTLISVTDHLDSANGWSRTTPRGEIRLYAYPPFNDEELGLYDDWMRQLLYHEYTHTLHTDNSRGLHSVLNYIFGTFAKNNAAAPHWYTEGLAVYYETKMSNRGRLRNPLYLTMLYNAARDRVIPSLGSLSSVPVRWPGGAASYLFGSFFIQYIADRFGHEALTQWNDEYGDDWIPYAMNRAALRVFKATWDELYESWRQSAYEVADKLYQDESDRITHHDLLLKPFRHGKPQWVPGTNSFSYIKNDGYHPQAIYQYDLDTKTETKIVECWGECIHRWDAEHGKLFFTHLSSEDGYKSYEKIYEMDLFTKKLKPLDIPGRIRSFDIDRGSLYWSSLEEDTMTVYRLDASDHVTVLYRSGAFEQIENISVRDGRIIASVFEPERHAFDIKIYKDGVWTSVTDDSELDFSPFWMHDGRIGYVSAHDQRLNLWAFDERTGQSERMTHLLDGMLHPVEAPNGDIYYTAYTSSGTTIARISKDALQPQAARRSGGTAGAEEQIEYAHLSDVSLSSSRRYKPWQWLWPLNWYPVLSYQATDKLRLGLAFNGADTLDHHSYQFKFEYLTGKNRFDFSLSYAWRALLWDITLSGGISQKTSVYLDGKQARNYDYQQVFADIGVRRIWNMRMSVHTLALQYRLSHLKAHDSLTWSLRDPAAQIWLPSLGWQNALYASWEWNSLRKAERAMTTGIGYDVWLSASLEAPWLGADQYTVVAEAGAMGAWTMPYLDSHTLQAKFTGGTSWSEDSQRYPFVLSSASGFAINSGNTMMHGYMTGMIYGSHYLYGHLAYDAGLYEFDLGYSTLPIGLSRIGAGVYADWGYAWRNGEWNILKSKYDIGMNLYIDWKLGYRLPVRMTLGYAWGGAPRGEHQVYMYFIY